MRAVDLVLAEICTPQCLLAMVAEDACKCRCEGEHHGALADIELDATPTERQEMAAFTSANVECDGCGSRIGNRTHYLMLSGRIQCGTCIREGGPYAMSQVFFRGSRPNALALWATEKFPKASR